MANPYTYTGPGTRWADGQATAENLLNVARINCDHLKTALAALIDTAAADGLNCSIAAPLKIEVAAGVVWSVGWWQSSDSNWWFLIRMADVASFTRAQADGYLPVGNIADVPAA